MFGCCRLSLGRRILARATRGKTGEKGCTNTGKMGEKGCTNTAWWVLEGVGWPKPALNGWNRRTGSRDLEQGHRKLSIKCSKPEYWRKVLAWKDRSSPGGSAVKSSDMGCPVLAGGFT